MQSREILKVLDKLYALHVLIEETREAREKMPRAARIALEHDNAMQRIEPDFSEDDLVWALTNTITSPEQKIAAIHAAGTHFDQLPDDLRTVIQSLADNSVFSAVAQAATDVLDEDTDYKKEQHAEAMEAFGKIMALRLWQAQRKAPDAPKHSPDLPFDAAAKPDNFLKNLVDEEAAIAAMVNSATLIDILRDTGMETTLRQIAMDVVTNRCLEGDITEDLFDKYNAALVDMAANGPEQLKASVRLVYRAFRITTTALKEMAKEPRPGNNRPH